MTAPMTDPYTILGVATEASDDDLDHAFRGLVRQLHPDTRTSATSAESEDDADQRLQELLDAYATLRDPIRRAAYDRARVSTATATKTPAAPSASGTSATDALVPDLLRDPSPIRVGPAIRVGPVYWEPPQATGRTPRDRASGAAGQAR